MGPDAWGRFQLWAPVQNLRGGKAQDMGGKWFIVQLVQDTETLKRSGMYRKGKWDQNIGPLVTVFENEPLESFNRNVKDLLKGYLVGHYILSGKVVMV